MKHQTINLVKFKALGMLLRAPQYATVGVLESLWLFAQHNATDGDLSRFSALQIAAWIGWDGDPDELIAAFIEAGWVDQDEAGMRIHDWEDHCPNWLRGVQRRQANRQPSTEPSTEPGSVPSTVPSSVPSTEPGSVPPNLTKPNLTKPNGVANATQGPRSKTAFVRPTVEEVAAYCRERGSEVDPAAFVDHYEANGWRVGAAPMWDWRATLRGWERKAIGVRGSPKEFKSRTEVATARFLAREPEHGDASGGGGSGGSDLRRLRPPSG